MATPPPNPNPKQEVGFALSIRNFLVTAEGLPTVKINDLVETEDGKKGWINGLLQDRVQVLMLDEASVSPRQILKKSGNNLGLSCGPFMIGRAISPLGVPIDGHGPLTKEVFPPPLPLEVPARGVSHRQFISTQFVTGISMVDSLIPIGQGQRELIIGDARSGKTRLLVDLVTNQLNKGVIVVYCLIGKPTTAVKNLITILESTGAIKHTIVVAAASTDPAPLVFLAPHSALTIAESFQAQGKDVLVVLDDMGNHAKVHREISLLSEKYPGREAYPGDIFYQHSRLMERAGKFTKEAGGGSITLLPVIEINLNDFTSFIPNNLMSMTDGHLLFKSDLFNTGQYPALDLGLSVSRVGRQTQSKIQNALSGKLKGILTQAAEYETLSRFSTELPQETQVTLRQKDLIYELIKHDPLSLIPVNLQVTLLSLIFHSWFKFQGVSFIRNNRLNILNGLITQPDLAAVTNKALNYKSIEELIDALDKLSPQVQALCKVK